MTANEPRHEPSQLIRRYRAKPCELEAVLHDGSFITAQVIVKWSCGKVSAANGDGTLSIETLEGTMIAQPGDFVVRGLKGEFYPVKPDIFQMKYEAAQ